MPRYRLPVGGSVGPFQSDPGNSRFGVSGRQQYQSSVTVHVTYSDGDHGTFVCSALSTSAHIDQASPNGGGGFIEDVENQSPVELFLDIENDPTLG